MKNSVDYSATTINFWDKVARAGKKNSSKALKQSASHALEACEKYLSREMNGLDIGCGGGAITIHLAERLKQVVGIDISQEMLAGAQELSVAEGGDNIQFCHHDLYSENLSPRAYNAIFAMNVLHYINDLPAFLGRVNELLSPSGVFISSTAYLGEKYSVLRGFMWLLGALHLMPKMRALAVNDMVTTLEARGLKVIEVCKISNLPEYVIICRGV